MVRGLTNRSYSRILNRNINFAKKRKNLPPDAFYSQCSHKQKGIPSRQMGGKSTAKKNSTGTTMFPSAIESHSIRRKSWINKRRTQNTTTAPYSFLYRLKTYITQHLLFPPSEITARSALCARSNRLREAAQLEKILHANKPGATFCCLFTAKRRESESVDQGKKTEHGILKVSLLMGFFSDCWLTEFGSVLINLISSSHYFL